jgi:hypothetical protein
MLSTTSVEPGSVEGLWRFTSADFDAATARCGPLESTLAQRGHGLSVPSLIFHSVEGRWRRFGPRRFVAETPGMGRTEVDWRLERGRWVISRIREHSDLIPDTTVSPAFRELASRMAIDRGRAPAADDLSADTMSWYRTSEPIAVLWRRYGKYGPPRTLDPSEIQQYAWIGSVRVYAERGHLRGPMVVYVPVGTYLYQPYQTEGDEPCPE